VTEHVYSMQPCCCCCGGTSHGQDGHNNCHDIHLKCVVACCSGTVADNDIAPRIKREEGYAEPEQKENNRNLEQKINDRKLFEKKNRFMGLSKKSYYSKTTAEEGELHK